MPRLGQGKAAHIETTTSLRAPSGPRSSQRALIYLAGQGRKALEGCVASRCVLQISPLSLPRADDPEGTGHRTLYFDMVT